MKSIILVGALLLLSGVTYGQKVKMKIPKKPAIKMPETKPGTNSVKPSENRKRPGGTINANPGSTERKRPGGTIETKPKTNSQKSSGTKPKPVPTPAVKKN